MYRCENGNLLKSKIVATLGIPRENVFDPMMKSQIAFEDSDEFWDKFLSCFIKDNVYLIDIIRLNMSFYESPGNNEKSIIKWLRLNKDSVRNVALLGDLQGPKLRIRGIAASGIALTKGMKFTLNYRRVDNSNNPTICLGERALGEIDENVYSKIMDHQNSQREKLVISIGDGGIKLILENLTYDSLQCIVDSGGQIFDRRGVNIRGIELDLPSFMEKDRQALDFLIDEGIDWSEDFTQSDSLCSPLAFIAISFVKSKKDVVDVKRYIYDKILEKLKVNHVSKVQDTLEQEAKLLSPAIIAKIETPQAWKNIDEILDVADGAMVARGDLAEQIGPQEVPAVQKQLIRLCNQRGKPVITATEMLASMENNPTPTRAEANDVFNAILDGSDAVMLSGETSKGSFPYQAVTMMIKIAEAAERQFRNFRSRRRLSNSERRHLNEQRYGRLLLGAAEQYDEIRKRLEVGQKESALNSDEWLHDFYIKKLRRNRDQDITDSISMSACILSDSGEEYTAILAPTTSGRTVRMLSRFRPDVIIIGAAHDSINRRKMIISYGVYPINCGTISDETQKKYSSAGQIFRKCCQIAKTERYLEDSDRVVYTAGTPLFVTGTTNLVQIKDVIPTESLSHDNIIGVHTASTR